MVNEQHIDEKIQIARNNYSRPQLPIVGYQRTFHRTSALSKSRLRAIIMHPANFHLRKNVLRFPWRLGDLMLV